MYKTPLSLLAALLFLSMACHAQVDFRFGPQLGVGVWGLAKSDDFTNSYMSYEDHQGAGNSGIFGLSGRWMLGKHWQVQHGLEYQRTTIHRWGFTHDDYATPYSSYRKYDNLQRLQMLSMPVSMGLVLGKGKVRASFNAGVRLGYLFSGVEEVNSEYTAWNSSSPMPAPLHVEVDFLKGHPRDRFMLQGLWTFQMEFAQKFTTTLGLATGPVEDYSPETNFYPPRTMAFFNFAYRPFGKELKAAPANGAGTGNWFETGPEIGYSMPIGFARDWRESTVYGTTTVRQSAKFTPMIGWASRFGISRHLFVDAALQYQFEGLHFESENLHPGQPYDYIYQREGTIGIHKLCLPLAVGYQMELGKFQPFVTAGFRANYLSYRKEAYEQKSYFAGSGANPEPIAYEYKGIYYPFAERLRGQVTASAGTGIGQHLRVGVTYAIGNGFNDDQAIVPEKYINQDLYLTVGWRFGKGRSASSGL